MLTELENEGFPDWMIYAFVSTAKETKTIVLSRTPGGVGKDLINASYDLKGFQIKAKSCNWGPMAGFICQLPFLNKAGAKKISYNTGNIFHYLACLKLFSGPRKEIDSIEAGRQKKLTYITSLKAENFTGNEANNTINKLVEDFADKVFDISVEVPHRDDITQIVNGQGDVEAKKTALRKINNKAYDTQLPPIIKKYRQTEQTTGEWSGENTIEEDSPFINLKRAFSGPDDEVIAQLQTMRGVAAASLKKLEQGKIYGYANDEAETVFIEFLLTRAQEGDTLWAIHHGIIQYKQGNAYIAYTPSVQNNLPSYFPILDEKTQQKYPIAATDKVNKDKAAENRAILDTIFSFSAESIDVAAPGNDKFPAGTRKFYPLRGFVNPHPPYKKIKNPDKSVATLVDNPLAYKNAVSGDYDLFAFWPANTTPLIELTRLSEKYLNANLKVFTDADMLLCIEMIPGFGEINPSADNKQLKESAELGNMSTLCATVAGTLNSFSNTFLKPLYPQSALNKAFHSDEGGRPGVLEIEFPIAVFLPNLTQSVALNNKYVDKKVPPFPNRSKLHSYGGLIKTPEELVQVIMEAQSGETQYQAIMQAEWMSHLFYISLPKKSRDDFRAQKGDFADVFVRLNKSDENGKELTDDKQLEKQKKANSEKIEEFEAIESNHGKIYPNADSFDQGAFEKNLKQLFKLPLNEDEEKFSQLRNKFLEMAFKTKRKAALRKNDIEQILYN
ncbi:MAG: hypothetical protein JWQ40_2421 [Segetibacter sp.]|nr:hypothetical protein [Segetibacter sp.]